MILIDFQNLVIQLFFWNFIKDYSKYIGNDKYKQIVRVDGEQKTKQE